MKSVTSLISGQIATEEEALLAVEQHPDTLSYIPEHLQTDNVIYSALIQKMDLFKLIEDTRFNKNLIKRLLTAKPHTREFIPHHLVTNDIFLDQVTANGLWLQHVPMESRTLEICLAAINQNVEAHAFVPSEVQQKNYLDELILIDPAKLNDVDVSNRSPFVVLRLLDKDHSAIRHLPLEYRTKEMCIKAVKKNIDAVRWIPDEYYEDEEIFGLISNHEYFTNFYESVEKKDRIDDKYNPQYVRPKLADYLVNTDVIKHFPLLPLDAITADHCKKAVQANPRFVQICPCKIRMENNLWEVALTMDGSILRTIPKNERTGAIEVLEKNSHALKKKESLFDIITENQNLKELK